MGSQSRTWLSDFHFHWIRLCWYQLWRNCWLWNNKRSKNTFLKSHLRLLWWLRGEESTSPCRRHRLDPWSGKRVLQLQNLCLRAWEWQLLSPCAAATEARTPQSPRPATRRHHDEKPACTLQLEKSPCAGTRAEPMQQWGPTEKRRKSLLSLWHNNYGRLSAS